MNTPDPLETRLARTPFRQAPSSLRAHVLAAMPQTRNLTAEGTRSRFEGWVAEWLWPHPAAWGTLALAWLVIAGLHLTALESPERRPGPRLQRMASPAWTAALRDQRALLHRLLEDPPAAALPPEPGPGALWRRENRRPQMFA